MVFSIIPILGALGYPKKVDLLACWKGQFARYRSGDICNAVPLCIMWIIWKEQNNQTFKGLKWSTMNVKMVFYALYMIGWLP